MPPSDNSQSISDRARNSSAVDPQDGLFDKQWDDGELEAALEAREEKRVARLIAQGEFKVANDDVQHKLDAYELAVGEVARIGRFRIKKTQPQPNHVEFTTDPAPRLNIGVIDDA